MAQIHPFDGQQAEKEPQARLAVVLPFSALALEAPLTCLEIAQLRQLLKDWEAVRGGCPQARRLTDPL